MAINSNVPVAANQISADLTAINANWEFLDWCGVVGNISFPATQVPSAGANVLDDYEEGTFNVTFTCGTSGTITVNTSFDTLEYIKIGKLVHIQGTIIVDSVSSPVGALSIGTLPFTATAGTERSGQSAITLISTTINSATDFLVARVNQSGTDILILQQAATGVTDDASAIIKASSELLFGGFYIAAA